MEDLENNAKLLAKENDIEEAINLILDAVRIYFDNGIYLRIADSIAIILTFLNDSINIYHIQEEINEIIQTMEYLDMNEEITKLTLVLANLSYQTNDYLNAGNLYIQVSELFNTFDPEEYRQVSGMLLLRAGECFEELKKVERAQKLVLDAIQRFDSSNFNNIDTFNHVEFNLQNRKYETAIENLREIAIYFRDLNDELELAQDINFTFKNIKKNVKARLLHIVSEYNFLKMLCFKILKKEEHIFLQAERSVDDLKEAIEETKEALRSGIYNQIDIKRLTFNGFLLQVFQEFANYLIEDPVDLVKRGIKPEIVTFIEQEDYYKAIVEIVRNDLSESTEIFEKIELPQILRPFRELIFHTLQKK